MLLLSISSTEFQTGGRRIEGRMLWKPWFREVLGEVSSGERFWNANAIALGRWMELTSSGPTPESLVIMLELQFDFGSYSPLR